MSRKLKQEVVCQKSKGVLLSPESSPSEKCREREASLMECAFTICAVLYIPYGHDKKPNWNISISVFPTRSSLTLTQRHNKNVQTRGSFFSLKTQSSRSSVMLFRWQHNSIEKHLSASSQSNEQGKCPETHSFSSSVLFRDLLIKLSALQNHWQAHRFPIEVWKWITSNNKYWLIVSLQPCELLSTYYS